jgi:hypothetical protein
MRRLRRENASTSMPSALPRFPIMVITKAQGHAPKGVLASFTKSDQYGRWSVRTPANSLAGLRWHQSVGRAILAGIISRQRKSERADCRRREPAHYAGKAAAMQYPKRERPTRIVSGGVLNFPAPALPAGTWPSEAGFSRETNMTNVYTPSRRHILGGLAASAACSVASATPSDAKLLPDDAKISSEWAQLFINWAVADSAFTAACHQLGDLEEKLIGAASDFVRIDDVPSIRASGPGVAFEEDQIRAHARKFAHCRDIDFLERWSGRKISELRTNKAAWTAEAQRIGYLDADAAATIAGRQANAAWEAVVRYRPQSIEEMRQQYLIFARRLNDGMAISDDELVIIFGALA